MRFKLRFPALDLKKWQAKNDGNPESLQAMGAASRKRGYLTQDEFREFCAKKSPRNKARYWAHSAALIREVTRIALSAKSEEVRIKSLMILDGVSWPTASFILHFCSGHKYPVLDFRALWSLSIDKPPPYTFKFWFEYVEYCRGLSDRSGLSMRQVDAALWKFSKENQGRSGSSH